MPGEGADCLGSVMVERKLPVRHYQARIVDKVRLNRVTLIYAQTGSGKSSQVPRMLLEAGLLPILCTQPRRLAVMAIAKHVAKDCNCVLGELVGYQIGQLNVSNSKTQIVFKTAGILLEELRSNGLVALSSYKVVILDEVHERSLESDLVLCCVKQLMLRSSKIRLVLMSATADFKRYQEYFKELSADEKVDVIAIPNFLAQLQHAMHDCSVKYLEHVVSQLGQRPEHLQLIASIQQCPLPCEKGLDIGVAIQILIRDWIVHLHKSEADARKTVLVFLPTYTALEQQWSLLQATGLPFRIYILHSSIDMEHLITAIEACHDERKVILATNLAESSVTIPNVSFVIDSCRSLEIYWSNVSKKHLPRLVWESQSQADQRKGRTGRTCSGIVFRMVPRSVYSVFEKFETPAMQLVSLRKQVLMLSCGKSRAINDPRVVFQRSMNPPQLETIRNAYEALVNLHALEVSSNQPEKYQPTFYGRLLGNLPLSLESSMLVVKGAEDGFIKESGILAAILDTSPYPIMQSFGKEKSFHETFFETKTQRESTSRPLILLIANLHAYEFWQHNFKDQQRIQRLLLLATSNEFLGSAGVNTPDLDDIEQKWCLIHRLSRASLQTVAETSAAIMEVMHRFRPSFMTGISQSPSYYRCVVRHQCKVISYAKESSEEPIEYEDSCTAVPYVSSEMYHTLDEENSLSQILMEVRTKHMLSDSHELEEESLDAAFNSAPLCSFFQMGSCKRGDSCSFSHSLLAKPAKCNFFMSESGCRYGEECRFRHDYNSVPSNKEELTAESVEVSAFDMLKCFTDEKYVFLIGDSDFSFAKHLASVYKPSNLLATVVDSKAVLMKASNVCEQYDQILQSGVQVFWGIDPTKLVPNSCLENMKEDEKSLISNVGCIVWNFPFLGSDLDTNTKRLSMAQFFASISIILMMLHNFEVLVLLTMSNSQYAQLQVERAARESFFFLISSSPPHDTILNCYNCRRKPMEGKFFTRKFITYAFQLELPHGEQYEELISHLEELAIS